MNVVDSSCTGDALSRVFHLNGPDDIRFSALLDGEIASAELDDALLAVDSDAIAQIACRRYQLIGQCLRGEPPGRQQMSPQVFLLNVQSRLRCETPVKLRIPLLSWRMSAVNDPVFRWKLAAGFASLVTAFVVSWSALGTAPDGAGEMASSSQMVLMSSLEQPQLNKSSSVVAPESAAPSVVAIDTAQGLLLRDGRLEQLLAEHRHYGGMSALQMPAGFLRDATHTANTQR